MYDVSNEISYAVKKLEGQRTRNQLQLTLSWIKPVEQNYQRSSQDRKSSYITMGSCTASTARCSSSVQ